MNEDLSMGKAIFFPYYVNQPRLLDIFAILNGGFSEYEELQTGEIASVKKIASVKAEAGFKLFRLGASGDFAKEKMDSGESRAAERKVHTTTSMLKIVLQELDEQGYLREIGSAQCGDFVVVPVRLKINSIKSLINEAIELAELSEKLKSLNARNGIKKPTTDISALKKIGDATRELFGSEEIVSESDEYAVVANIDDRHLYQSDRRKIVGVDMKCLCQVRLVHDGGAQLLRNTVFAKMNDSDAKRVVVDSLISMTSSIEYSFDNDVIPAIEGKPVYEMEIVALYQDTYPVDSDDV